MKIIFSHYCLHLTDRTQGLEEHCQISKVLLHVKTVTVTVTVQYNFINYKISFTSLSSSQLESYSGQAAITSGLNKAFQLDEAIFLDGAVQS